MKNNCRILYFLDASVHLLCSQHIVFRGFAALHLSYDKTVVHIWEDTCLCHNLQNTETEFYQDTVPENAKKMNISAAFKVLHHSMEEDWNNQDSSYVRTDRETLVRVSMADCPDRSVSLVKGRVSIPAPQHHHRYSEACCQKTITDDYARYMLMKRDETTGWKKTRRNLMR